MTHGDLKRELLNMETKRLTWSPTPSALQAEQKLRAASIPGFDARQPHRGLKSRLVDAQARSGCPTSEGAAPGLSCDMGHMQDSRWGHGGSDGKEPACSSGDRV